MNPLLEKAMRKPFSLTHAELAALLTAVDPAELAHAAYALKCRLFGKKVVLRGLIELGNVCAKDCFYCGIRRSNAAVVRYRLAEDDAVRMAQWAYEQRYGSVVLQSGEIETEENTVYIERILRRIKTFAGEKLGITLCLGEQSEAVYRRWREAGAHRYLLRIETSNPGLYRRIHPPDHSFARRREALLTLRGLGYQLGSGVMTGLPGQTPDDLAADLEFFRAVGVDMLGMGPWLPHRDAPLGRDVTLTPEFNRTQLEIGLRMIAAARLYLHDVNIAATTALQALDDRGREAGILAGANVLMPNVTDVEYRKHYQLYENKPCLDENSARCRNCLAGRMLAIGETIHWGVRGDPPHFRRKDALQS